MVITYNGAEFFKVQFGTTTIAFNPISKDSKLKSSRFGADIALVTTNHPDMNGVESVSHGERQPFVISGPGEYETKDVFIKGFESHSSYGGSHINTIYIVNLDSMNLCFLGALDTGELKKEIIEDLGDIDILFVPIGGDGVLEPAAAYRLAVQLEPKVIIPMHYTINGDDKMLKLFLKETGESGELMDKYTVKKKDIEGKEGEIVVLKAE
jgi:L-ascorbate metabolism protein UlaG (beta-lactamase superfamily)